MLQQHKATRGRFETIVKSVGTKALPNGGEAVLIEGYASTPHIDRGDDITEPSAFTKTLELYMTNPVLLWDHGMDKRYGYMPIGKITEAGAEARGLKIKGEVTDPEVGGAILRGELRTMSFGYEVPEGGFYFKEIDGRTVRVITELNLYEISVVAIPMNPHASFSLAKSLRAYFAAVDGGSKSRDATSIPTSQPNAERMEEPQPEQVTAPDAETPESTESAPELTTTESAAEPEAEVKTVEPEAETPAPVVEETKAADDAPAAEVAVESETPVVEAGTPPVDNADTSSAEATDADTAVQAEPNEQKSAPAPETQDQEVSVESKSMASVLEPEVKTLSAKYVDLEAKHAALETRYAQTVERVEAELKTFDTAFSKLTDLVVKMKKVQDETPVNSPFIVSPSLAKTATPEEGKNKPWYEQMRVVERHVD